ncbi:MAG: bifunctional DNA-formamidopyrimidine glycosylase/DNA-(apurinic or apyrimidinic site) lyase [Candidatus Paceibacterota bacterium]
MPELPEVEMVRRQLTDKIIGKQIASVEVCDWKSVDHNRNFATEVAGRKIVEIERVGKYLFLTLDQNNLYIAGHLKMTGRLIYQGMNDPIQYGGGHALSKPQPEQPHKHTRIIFTFTDGSHLYFNDMRKFGYMKLATAAEVEDQKQALGPEPITDLYSKEYLDKLLADRKTSVKAALLKQSDIAGLGNIYVDEACWRAKIRPDRIAGNLTPKEIKHLYTATRTVLEDAINFGGTTFRDYVDTNGEHGNFTDELAVFGRQGEACRRCEAIIEKTRVAGRGTHFCPGCQV